jgi:hypothetical protein
VLAATCHCSCVSTTLSPTGVAPGDTTTVHGAFVGVTLPSDFFTDHVDVRRTRMFLTGLTDDYQHDGRVILELLDSKILPSSLHTHSESFWDLGQIYKQINAPFGALAENTLKVSTFAITSDTPGDVTYTILENLISSWTAERPLSMSTRPAASFERGNSSSTALTPARTIPRSAPASRRTALALAPEPQSLGTSAILFFSILTLLMGRAGSDRLPR